MKHKTYWIDTWESIEKGWVSDLPMSHTDPAGFERVKQFVTLEDYNKLKLLTEQQAAEIERLKAATPLMCAYCSFEAPPGSKVSVLQKHILTCEHHPLLQELHKMDISKTKLCNEHRQLEVMAESYRAILAKFVGIKMGTMDEDKLVGLHEEACKALEEK